MLNCDVSLVGRSQMLVWVLIFLFFHFAEYRMNGRCTEIGFNFQFLIFDENQTEENSTAVCSLSRFCLWRRLSINATKCQRLIMITLFGMCLLNIVMDRISAEPSQSNSTFKNWGFVSQQWKFACTRKCILFACDWLCLPSHFYSFSRF